MTVEKRNINREFYPLTITAVQSLTQDAIMVSFDIPEKLQACFHYQQGQYITLKTTIDGVDVRRPYSICSNDDEQKIRVAIKRIHHGCFSSFAHEHFTKGMTLEVQPPQGNFYTPLVADHKKHYLFIAVGSGITPIISNIESILLSESQAHVTLLYGNGTTRSMMFKEKLSFIKNKYLSRFQWVNVFSQEEQNLAVLNGRLSTEKLVALHDVGIIDLSDFDHAFICGPQMMAKDMIDAFKFWQWSADRIHAELFFSADGQAAKQAYLNKRQENMQGATTNLAVTLAGRKTLIASSSVNETILDIAMQQGLDLPFSCKAGVCATCKAKLISGEVSMPMAHALSPEDVARGMVLTCQAYPLTADVQVDFDVL